MFEAKTSLIVGAGASMDYGLPSGPELWKSVRETFQGIELSFAQIIDHDPFLSASDATSHVVRDSPRLQALAAFLEGNGDDLFQSARQISQAVTLADVHSSVDEFIRDHPRLADPLKVVVAGILFESLYGREGSRFLRSPKLESSKVDLPGRTWEKNWVRQFVGVCRAFVRDKSPSQRTTVVSFNYDRIVETVLGFFWDRSEQQYCKISDCFEFLYPYGAFDNLPPQISSPAQWIVEQSKHIGTAGKGSKVVGEIQTALKESQTIFSVGFSFSRENMTLLGIDSRFRDRLFYQNFETRDLRLNRAMASIGVGLDQMDEGGMTSLVGNGFFEQRGQLPSEAAIRRPTR